jgi:hypothetical protein
MEVPWLMFTKIIETIRVWRNKAARAGSGYHFNWNQPGGNDFHEHQSKTPLENREAFVKTSELVVCGQ